MDTLLGDLRYAGRGLIRTKGVALVAVIALALGIGLTTVMFSIVYGAMYRGLPFDGADRIMVLNRSRPSLNQNRMGVSIHDYADWAERQRSFESLAGFYSGTVNVTSGERPDRYSGGWVTANTMAILGVQPILGRSFAEEDARPGAPMTLLLGFRAWRDHFGSDHAVIGRTVKVNGEAGTVIGVMPEGFRFPETQDVWVPLRLDPLATPRGQGSTLTVVGKLKEGITLDAANAELVRIAAALATEHPESNRDITADVRPYADQLAGNDEGRTLLAMLATVGLVLLIACANVANLLLARAAVRARDVAIRVSLGASRARVITQMLAEALVLALLGALLGAGLAWVGIGWFGRTVAKTDPPFWFVFRLDAPVLAFVAATSVVAAVLSGAIPALRSSATDLNAVLKDESRGSLSLRIGRLSRGLVVAEVAMSVALLVASGLMIRSVVALDRLNLPYPTRDVFTARVALLDQKFTEPGARLRFWEAVEERVSALPGVKSVGLVDALPGSGANSPALQIEGVAYATEADIPHARTTTVSPGFFTTFDVEAVQGRLFSAMDGGDAPKVAIVNQSFVRSRFPDGNALGRHIRVGALDTKEEWREIVGVVPDLGMTQVNESEKESPAGLYLPVGQSDPQFLSIAARAQGDPLTLTGPVRDAVVATDPDTPIYFVDTLQGRINENLWFYRVFGTLFVVFGAAALFMASVGLYGVMSFSVSRRVQEMGIRMALGAQSGQVRGLVIRQGMTQIAIGMVIGAGLAVLVAKGLSVLIFGAQAWDPLTYAIVFTVLGLTGFAASAAPAARATRIDPIEALRGE